MEWSEKEIQDLIGRVKVEEGRDISLDEANELANEIFFWVKLLALKNDKQ